MFWVNEERHVGISILKELMGDMSRNTQPRPRDGLERLPSELIGDKESIFVGGLLTYLGLPFPLLVHNLARGGVVVS